MGMARGIGWLTVVLALASATASTAERLDDEAAANLAALTDVAQLERLVADRSLEAQPAYLRLGQLGTPEALAALERIDAAGRRVRPARDAWRGDVHPAWHFEERPFTPQVCGAVGTGSSLAVAIGAWIPGGRFYLTWPEAGAPGTWARPRLLTEQPAPRQPRRYVRSVAPSLPMPGRLRIGYDDVWFERADHRERREPQSVEVDLTARLLDRDGDGWTDLEERLLGLDPARADTDGDGLADGDDVTPDFAPTGPPNDDDELVQRAIFTLFGLRAAHAALVANQEGRRVQFWGYGGPILYNVDCDAIEQRTGYRPTSINWELRRQADWAAVTVRDHEGPLAASTQEVRLVRRGGRWMAVDVQMLSIS